jgi:acetate---CoA ligase (ADP-forming)
LPALAESTENRLSDVIPAYGTVQNPLDVTGAAIIDPTVFARSVEIMSADPSVGVVAMVASLPWVGDGEPIAAGVSYFKAAASGIANAAVPVVYVNQVVQPITDYSRRIMVEAGIPYVLPGLRQMIVALRNVGWWSDIIRPHVAESQLHNPSPMAPHRVDRHGAWSEYKARQLLASAGIPVAPGTLVTSSDTAVIAAKELGTPVAVKIVSPDILHKTDIGGVRLDVAGDDAVREAYDAVTAAAAARPGARLEGVLVASMRSGGTTKPFSTGSAKVIRSAPAFGYTVALPETAPHYDDLQPTAKERGIVAMANGAAYSG